jgi:tetratricopeptide (TPR) repeat protein
LTLSLVAGASGCAPPPVRDAAAPERDGRDPTRGTAGHPAPVSSIQWYRDDPAAALARATSEGKLVVVDLWAAWCHTCLSMQEFVLTDEKLPGVASRFVFLAVDTELARNAAFLDDFPPSGWPTFYVLAPAGPAVRARWIGAASPGQFARFLADAEHADELARAGSAGAEEPWASLARADALASQARFAEAAESYGQALARAPSGWHRAPDVRVSRASALLRAGNPGACVDMVFELSFETQSPAISAADHASHVLTCVEQLAPSDPRRRPARERIEARLRGLCEDGAAELTPDDRGDACGNLISVREALEDPAGAKRAAEVRLALLEAAASGVPDDVAVMYDPARTDTLLWLGRGEEALGLLEARRAALPDNYTPPYLVGRVALKLRRFELGLAAITRALDLVHGPRRANVHAVQAELLAAAGRPEEATLALRAQLRVLEALPERQKRPEAERRVRERIEKLRAAPR